MPARQIKSERLIVLLLFGVLALNYPLLSIFNRAHLWLGIPVLYLYLFLFWAMFIGLLAWVMERGSSQDARPKPRKPHNGK